MFSLLIRTILYDFKSLQKTMKKRDGIQSSLVSKDMPLFIHPYGSKEFLVSSEWKSLPFLV
jgi:hypothetical protein